MHEENRSGGCDERDKKFSVKILIIQTAFLGDCVLSLPLVNTLKKNFSCSISVLSRPGNAAVFECSSGVDEVIKYDKDGSEKGFTSVLRLAGRLKKSGYDRVFLPQRSFRSGLISYMAGIPERIGYKRGGAKMFCNTKVDFDWSRHDVERQLDLASAAGCGKMDRSFKLQPPEKEKKYIREKLPDGKKLVGMCAQSQWKTKCWPFGRFMEVASLLPGDTKAVLLGKKPQETESDSIINLTARTSLTELFAIINRLDILLSNDTGLIHIAAAMGVPVVAVFGPTVKGMGFAPYGEGHTVIEKSLDCRPCGLHGGKKCPRGHFRCMLDIPVSEVAAPVMKRLQKIELKRHS